LADFQRLAAWYIDSKMDCSTTRCGVNFSYTHCAEVSRLPLVSRRARLKLSGREIKMLTALSQSRIEPAGRVQRASMVSRYRAGDTVSAIARTLGTNRPRIERCVSKALDLGVVRVLVDLPGRGRRPVMTAEARAWVDALAGGHRPCAGRGPRVGAQSKQVHETPVAFRWK
jgi:hypothetical protein